MTQITRMEWTVGGMDCSSCKAKIERVVLGSEGVSRAEVHFMSQKLIVEFNPEKTSSQVLYKRVVGLGYSLKETHNPLKPPTGSESPKNLSNLLPNAIPNSQQNDSHSEEHHHSHADGVSKKQTFFVVAGFVGWALAYLGSRFFAGTEFPLFAALAILTGASIAKKAFQSARAGMFFTIEMLMTLACVGALFVNAPQEAATVVVLFSLGEWLESVAAAHARRNIKALLELAPPFAFRVEKNSVQSVPSSFLLKGDLIEIRPGSRVPTDGVVTTGQSQLDESLLTGESQAVFKSEGDKIFAGTLNGDGVLRVLVTETAANNSLARILNMVEDAQSRRSKTARFIDEFSKYYTPSIFALAVFTAILPPLFSSGQSFENWVYRGLGILLIGCPCALVLSVPAAVTSAIAWGARRGLLVKGGAALEMFGKVRTIAFDKTGTLTRGKPAVVAVHSFHSELMPDEVLLLAAGVEQSATHPLALAIVAAAVEKNADIPEGLNAQNFPGRGMTAQIWGQEYLVSSPRYGAEKRHLLPEHESQIVHFEEQGATVVVLHVQGKTQSQILGCIALQDTLRPDARASLSQLQKMGIASVVLTGDNKRAGQRLSEELGVQVQAELLPEQKLEEIESLKKSSIVCMVGDGVNDAPALAAAHVGVSMGEGTDVAIEAADAVLSRNTVQSVVQLVRLSRRTRAIVQQNVGVALGLKLIFLATTVTGATGLWMAVLADTGATVLVMVNSLRLLRSSESSNF